MARLSPEKRAAALARCYETRDLSVPIINGELVPGGKIQFRFEDICRAMRWDKPSKVRPRKKYIAAHYFGIRSYDLWWTWRSYDFETWHDILTKMKDVYHRRSGISFYRLEHTFAMMKLAEEDLSDGIPFTLAAAWIGHSTKDIEWHGRGRGRHFVKVQDIGIKKHPKQKLHPWVKWAIADPESVNKALEESK